jgi:hypothetical protein
MKQFSLQPTTSGLKNIPKLEIRNNFNFIVGNSHYKCPYYIADFISPAVSRLHVLNPPLSEFYIETSDAHGRFEDIISIGYGESLRFSKSERFFFLSVFRELDNSAFIHFILEDSEEPLSISNAIESLGLRCQIDIGCDHIVTFVAIHLSEFSISSFDCLSDDILELILSHPELKLESEDSLYNLILSRIERDFSSVSLLEYVHFEFLSSTTISRFCESSQQFFSHLTISIWSRICTRLGHDIIPQSTNPRLICPPGLVLKPDANSVLDGGIISYLSGKYGTDFASHSVLEVTALSTNDPSQSPINATALKTNTIFASKNEPNQWISYNFCKSRIIPSHYSIRSYYAGHHGYNNLRSWVIEGSVDGKAWIEIDRRDHNNELNEKNASCLFDISHRGEYQIIRLRQTGKNHHNDDYLVFCAFELFGTFLESVK